MYRRRLGGMENMAIQGYPSSGPQHGREVASAANGQTGVRLDRLTRRGSLRLAANETESFEPEKRVEDAIGLPERLRSLLSGGLFRLTV